MLVFDPGSLTFVIVGLLSSVLLIFTVVLCLCKQRLGKSGDCPIDNHLQVNRDPPTVKPQLPDGQQNGDVRSASPSEKGPAHARAVTERALPTPPGRPQSLPASLVIANNNGQTPAATTTPDSRSSTLVRPHRRNKAPAPPPPAQATTPSAATAEDAQERGDTRSESSESDPLYSVATARQPTTTTDDPAPPVPEKRFETSSEPGTSDGAFRPLSVVNNSEAGSAATSVPSANPATEVPFAAATLTEPLGNVSSTTGTSDLSYTVISVREPLAKVREETMRQRRVQNSATQEAFYTEVPEEEQMYAEIESGHNSAGSSVTYARIEPRGPDQPPAPPTVESLKSVAQAHSRQASTSSFTGGTSPDGEANALYTTVDKSSKQRQTIHVSEGLSAEGVPLNDLYAKVHKTKPTRNQEDAHKAKSTATSDEASLNHRPRSLPVGVEPALPHDSRALLPVHDVAPLVEPLPPPPLEYADPAYERVYHQDSSDTDPCYERVSGGRTDVSDPDYERVGNSEPGYETIRRDASVMYDEPDYEKIRKNNDASCSTDAKEGTYVTVSDHEVEYNIEHGYERIKAAKDTSYDETSDPGYERIKRRDDQSYDEVSDPGYEKIRKLQDDVFLHADSDPGYERIKESNVQKRIGSGERRHTRTKKQGEASLSTKSTKQNGGSSDETYECLPGTKLKPRDLGYHLMKDAPSSGDSQSVSWKGDSSSSLDKADAMEDSSSEEPGYDKVKPSRDDMVPPEAPPRGRLSLRTKGWPSSDSNLTNVCQEQASQCNLSASASAVVHDPTGTVPDDVVACMYDSNGVALYEVVPEVKVQVEDAPVLWTRNSGHRASDHREYIF